MSKGAAELKRELIPAVMPKDYLDLRAKLGLLEGKAPWVQIDMMDGVLTPAASWPFTGDSEWEELIAGEEGLPDWEKVQYEADLIMNRPQEFLEECLQAGFARVVFHLRSSSVPETIIHRCHLFDVEVGVALWQDDDLERLSELVEAGLDYVQVMGIEKVGFQGQLFAEDTPRRVEEIHKRFPDLLIQIDGAVDEATLPLLAEVGATRFVAGSALFAAEDVARAFERWQAEI